MSHREDATLNEDCITGVTVAAMQSRYGCLTSHSQPARAARRPSLAPRVPAPGRGRQTGMKPRPGVAGAQRSGAEATPPQRGGTTRPGTFNPPDKLLELLRRR